MDGNQLTRKDGSEREIERPSEEEKKKQREILEKLTPKVYSQFEDFVFGIPDKGQHDAVERFVEYRDDGYQWIASLDVKDCFGSINPEEALSLIDYDFEEIPEISERDGLPQGHPLSSLLAEVYLNQLDRRIADWPENGCKVIRWRDDIWLMSKTKKEVLSYAYLLNSFAQDLDLDLALDSRMRVNHVNQGVEILGFTVDRWSIAPSPENVRKQKEHVMHLLNGILRGLRDSEYDRVSELREELTNSIQKWNSYFLYARFLLLAIVIL